MESEHEVLQLHQVAMMSFPKGPDSNKTRIEQAYSSEEFGNIFEILTPKLSPLPLPTTIFLKAKNLEWLGGQDSKSYSIFCLGLTIFFFSAALQHWQ